MNANPYAHPNVPAAGVATRVTTAEPPFFAVSLPKLAVMSLCTIGLYEIYWFYRNWQSIRERERSDLSPAPRAILAVFFCYACFGRIRRFDVEKNGSSRLPAGVLAIGWIFTTLVCQIPAPYWWLSMFAFLFLLPVQAHANRLNAQASPSHDRNTRLGGWNWVAIVVGGPVLLLVIAGSVFPGVP